MIARRHTRATKIVVIVVAAVVVSGGLAFAAARANRHPAVVVGYSATTSTPPTEPATIPQPETTLPPPEPPINGGPPVGLKVADGQPYPAAIEFTSTIPIPEDLVFILVLGSDARPKEDLLKTRSDSIHLVALNPRSGQGSIVGFPRDSYVDYPNGGRGKINDALARGGPTYVAETIRRLTGLPVQYYVLTGFVGLAKMVDDLGASTFGSRGG